MGTPLLVNWRRIRHEVSVGRSLVSMAYWGVAFQEGSVQVVLGHILHLSEYLTPAMLVGLRESMDEWRKDGLTLKR